MSCDNTNSKPMETRPNQAGVISVDQLIFILFWRTKNKILIILQEVENSIFGNGEGASLFICHQTVQTQSTLFVYLTTVKPV